MHFQHGIIEDSTEFQWINISEMKRIKYRSEDQTLLQVILHKDLVQRSPKFLAMQITCCYFLKMFSLFLLLYIWF